MSARSPRSSLSGASSAEVADDFGESLKDLQINNRYEISNLTLIAKENTEHAQAISKTLETHIKTTSPSRKLPALYVLDSIVKNVGTPYTVYLGRNLYSTFMEAYTQVDGNTRRNMEATLKTWKEAVPGSMDPRPVFPPETVRPIENALIKAKTLALQSSRQSQAQFQPEHRNTPTPPQYNGRFAAPPVHGQAQPYPAGNGMQQQHPMPPNFPPTPLQQHQHAYAAPNTGPMIDVESIKRNVATLVTQRQAQFGANPFDQGVQTQLKNLLALQHIVNTQTLSVASLQEIRNQVSGLAAQAPTPQQPPRWQPPPSSHPQPPHIVQTQVPFSQPPPFQQQPPAPLIAPGALNSLQQILSSGQKPGTPQMRAAVPALQNASHTQLSNVQNQAAAATTMNGADLISSLRSNGLLPHMPPQQPPPPTVLPPITAPPPQSTAALLQSLKGFLPPPPHSGTPVLPPAHLASNKPRIPMTAASLKTFHPELIHALYDAQPNQCSTCGRRFLATEEGRAKKDLHLDWHFRTNQRIADPSISRGAHRDWFLPEIEWIQLGDFDPSTTTAGTAVTAAKEAEVKQKGLPQDSYVRAPPGVTKNTCSICYEEMKSSYSEELQDWVFVNAKMYGGKIVHATCLAEMQKGGGGGGGGGGSLAAALAAAAAGGGGQRQRSATPDSTLGKRKADGSMVR